MNYVHGYMITYIYAYVYIIGGQIGPGPQGPKGAHQGQAHKGPAGPQEHVPHEPLGAQKGQSDKRPWGPTRVRHTRAKGSPQWPKGAHKGPVHKGLGGPQGPGQQRPRGAHKGPRTYLAHGLPSKYKVC